MNIITRTINEIPGTVIVLAATLFAVGSLGAAVEPGLASRAEVQAVNTRIDDTNAAIRELRADLRWWWATAAGASLAGGASGAAVVVRRNKTNRSGQS